MNRVTQVRHSRPPKESNAQLSASQEGLSAYSQSAQKLSAQPMTPEAVAKASYLACLRFLRDIEKKEVVCSPGVKKFAEHCCAESYDEFQRIKSEREQEDYSRTIPNSKPGSNEISNNDGFSGVLLQRARACLVAIVGIFQK